MPGFQNAHLSYSRLSRFEQCPLSFKLHYIDKQLAEPGIPLLFGKAVHAALENLVREVIDNELTGPLSEARALELFQEAWAANRLSGLPLFQEGTELIKNFVRDQGTLNHHDLLAVEQEFRLAVGDFTVLGYMDRVDRVDDETVEVFDYKTNRMIFSRDEVDNSLQMSLYHLAARQLWPWATKVKLTFVLLRHGIRMETSRTPEQLELALQYVQTLGKQTEAAFEFPPRLNANCVYCDHRRQCPAFTDALAGKQHLVCENLDDLEAVAREREEVARITKILTARKQELEEVIKAHLEDQDELSLAGVTYRMFKTSKVEYPVDSTLKTLTKATGLSRDDLLGKLASIEKKALEAFLKDLAGTLEKPRLNLLKAELEAIATRSFSSRFWAKGE
jgi:putative RecB family exonuclease